MVLEDMNLGEDGTSYNKKEPTTSAVNRSEAQQATNNEFHLDNITTRLRALANTRSVHQIVIPLKITLQARVLHALDVVHGR
jgi:hypothetical protein